MPNLDLNIFGIRWRIRCDDNDAAKLIARNFSEFIATTTRNDDPRPIEIRSAPACGWVLESNSPPVIARDTYELLYHLEKIITIDAQIQRSDLFFLHSAALAYHGVAMLLVAASGSGKSTTAWALAKRGFGYLSDELAPIDLEAFEVEPYPHALCLKSAPPTPFEVSDDILVTPRTLHVPTTHLPEVVRKPTPLKAIFFNRFDPAATIPQVSTIGKGEASALLYTHALNPLAHHQAGLRGVATIAAGARAYALTTCDLELTCELVRATLDELLATPNSGE